MPRASDRAQTARASMGGPDATIVARCTMQAAPFSSSCRPHGPNRSGRRRRTCRTCVGDWKQPEPASFSYQREVGTAARPPCSATFWLHARSIFPCIELTSPAYLAPEAQGSCAPAEQVPIALAPTPVPLENSGELPAECYGVWTKFEWPEAAVQHGHTCPAAAAARRQWGARPAWLQGACPSTTALVAAACDGMLVRVYSFHHHNGSCDAGMCQLHTCCLSV